MLNVSAPALAVVKVPLVGSVMMQVRPVCPRRNVPNAPSPPSSLADNEVQGDGVAEQHTGLLHSGHGRDVGSDSCLHVTGAATVDTPSGNGRPKRRGLPLGEVAGRDDVDVALEDDGGHSSAPPAGADQSPSLGALGLDPGEVRVLSEGVQVHRPRVHVETHRVELAGQEMLDVAFGIGAAHARDGQ